MTEKYFHLEYSNHTAIVTMDRPDRLNAFNETMWDEFGETVGRLTKQLPRVVVLTGAGNTFSAGFDVNPDNPQVSALMTAIQAGDRTPIENLIGRIRHIVDGFTGLPVPIIAAVNGKAYGGGAELAVRCDMRVLEPGAVICFSEVRLGLMPDWGGGAALSRLVGPAHAADLVLTGREVSAEEALAMGLANRVTAPGQALAVSMELAKRIAQNGPRAVRSALEVIRSSGRLSLNESFELEMKRAVSLIASGECFHGISAFLSDKTPEFPDIRED
jgi:enoyl-CoA hydratase/carnithine racemase